jgi:hypothetical protein
MPKEKNWTEDDDNRLVELYELYSSFDKETCFQKLASAFSRHENEVTKRLKKLKIIGNDEIRRDKEERNQEKPVEQK